MSDKAWTEVVDRRTGRKYYANRSTGESSWTLPAGADSAGPREPPPISTLQARRQPASGIDHQEFSRVPPPLSTLTTRTPSGASPRTINSATGPANDQLSRSPPPLTSVVRKAQSPTAEMEMQAIRPTEQVVPGNKGLSAGDSNPLRRRLTEDEEQGEPGGGKSEPPSVGCCLCGFSRRRNCCICCWSVFVLIVGLLVFVFWPRASSSSQLSLRLRRQLCA
jgi:hypothetical protein